MNGKIKEIKNDLIKYFVEESHGVDMVFSLKVKLANFGLEFAPNGNKEVDKKHSGRHPYLISSNSDESEMLLIVYHPSIYEDDDSFSMCCIKRGVVYEFVNSQDQSLVKLKSFKSDVGNDMFIAFQKFSIGNILPCMKPVTSGVGFDIIQFKKSFS